MEYRYILVDTSTGVVSPYYQFNYLPFAIIHARALGCWVYDLWAEKYIDLTK